MARPLVTHAMRVGDVCDRFGAFGFVLLEIRKQDVVVCARKPGVSVTELRQQYHAECASRRRYRKKRLDDQAEAG